jgi:hypothetical protein
MPDKKAKTPAPRKRWESISVTDVGHIGDVLQGGGGKTSPAPHDPGETFKPPGQTA